LLGTRYAELARNTIDYWMVPDTSLLSAKRVLAALEHAPALPTSTLRLYLHVPFCAQRCRFCAFSGGNSLDWQQAQRYARLLVRQLHDLWGRSAMRGQPIRSVNIGGGSPDLLGPSIDDVLVAIRELPGFDDNTTELAVEFTLSTVKPDFIDRLAAHGVTKVSFGVQSLDPQVRGYMRQPKQLRHLGPVLDWISGRIPVVNADLITGMPGQTRASVSADLDTLMAEPRINALSSYLLTTGAAPSLLAGIERGQIPPPPPPLDQALMRLDTYGTFRRAGWIRRGTNTYVDPARIEPRVLSRLAGDECLGASQYETHLLGIGPQAVSSLPGLRIENQVDVESWSASVERDQAPFCVSKCSTAHQRDMALWAFPLRWEGLARATFDAMCSRDGALRPGQLETFAELRREGLVVEEPDRYCLSLLGEVVMGHLVRDLKADASRAAIDAYIEEGKALGRAVARGQLRDNNALNDRQRASEWLQASDV
jgi:oxygen-independent coproporphyrinogen-3 oxidase